MFNPRVGIAFFFFAFDDKSKRTNSAMLRVLVLQLSGQLIGDHNEVLSRLHNISQIPQDRPLTGCLRELVCAFDSVHILLDGLDEIPHGENREAMLQTLVEMRKWSEPRLHVLVTSRDEPDIRHVLSNELGAASDQMLSMNNESADRDIAGFISEHLRQNPKLSKWEDQHDLIEAALTERAKGV